MLPPAQKRRVSILPSVALVGQQGSGKSAIAYLLVREHGYLRHSWADGVRHIFEMAYETITPSNYPDIKAKKFDTKVITPEGTRIVQRTGGELLQLIGAEALRNQVDQDFWIKVGTRTLFRDQMVNDDTRYLNEAEALRDRGWVVVRVTAPEDVRRARIGGAFRPENHSSETEQQFIAEDYVLNNDGTKTLEEVVAELLEYLRSTDNSFMGRAQRALSDGPI